MLQNRCKVKNYCLKIQINCKLFLHYNVKTPLCNTKTPLFIICDLQSEGIKNIFRKYMTMCRATDGGYL